MRISNSLQYKISIIVVIIFGTWINCDLRAVPNTLEVIPLPTDAQLITPDSLDRSKSDDKLETALSRLVDIYNKQDIQAAKEFARIHDLALDEDRVQVEFSLQSTHLPGEISDSELQAYGAIVDSRSLHFMIAWIPIDTLTALAAGFDIIKEIHHIRKPIASVVSEGVALTGADNFHDLNVTGEGVSIAVLDGGFATAEDAQANGELPATWTGQDFTGTGLYTGSVHGAACAEIVYDMAPDADFYLVKISTNVDYENAVDWIIAQNIDVVTMSLGWMGPFSDYYRGTDAVCGKVADAYNAGIFFATSAGNEALSHHRDDFDDLGNGDNYHRFDGVASINHFGPNSGQILLLPRSTQIQVSLSWDDFPDSGNDFNLYLAKYSTGPRTWSIIASSVDVQNGDDPPTEWIGWTTSGGDAGYGVIVENENGADGTDFTIFASHDFAYPTTEGSLSIPAMADDAFTVGAVYYSDWNDPAVQPESFSSRGPTYDGDIKPNLAAPDGTDSYVYNGEFYGTSASCPHVGGAAALLKSANPGLNNQTIANYLTGHADDVGDDGQDNLFGYGLLNLEYDFDQGKGGNYYQSPEYYKHTIDGNFKGATDVYACDLDGDGNFDVLAAGYDTDEITWWENDGHENFTEHVIASGFDGSCAVSAIDLDSDGDQDVLGTAELADDITWWENDNGDGSSWSAHTIKGDWDGAQDVFVIDLDSDGDLDVLGAAGGTSDDVTWWENDGSESFTLHNITTTFDGACSVNACDIDGDGDYDVVGAAWDDDEITWWESDGTPDDGWTEHVISTTFDGACACLAIDLDNDGDVDLVGAADLSDDVTWWENNGAESFTERIIEGNFDGACDVYVTDMDGDGRLDVVSTARDGNTVAWWENDGSPTDGGWTGHFIDDHLGGAEALYTVDLDRDGFIDILTAAGTDDDVIWWENITEPPPVPVFTEHTIDGDFDGALSVTTGDVDGDGDVDVLGAASVTDEIAWWENDGSQSYTKRSITASFLGAEEVAGLDLDGDGDFDILGAAYEDDDISWWKNDGSQNFTKRLIDDNLDGASFIMAVDLDKDGDNDVVAAGNIADEIAWYENNGSQAFSKHSIDNSFDEAKSIFTADIDGDGDIDVLGTADQGNTLSWWENDGSQNFTRRNVDVSFTGASSCVATDLDHDGDVDLLGAASVLDDITWWENDGTPANGGWIEHTIKGDFDGAYSIYTADVDGDGDMDVLGAAHTGDDITWWENDGTPAE
ncbi:VCBS repeat-containing protein, partial [bacterium]|nr:VCBS repeat-containing protein [bacterium]